MLILWPAPGFDSQPGLSTADPRAPFAVKRGLAFIQSVARDRKGFLRSNIRQAIGTHDPEALGEYIDTLKSFGLTEADAEMGAGIRYLLAHQNADGSWGDPADPDLYDRYHTTWTAIDGLREYRWHGERVAFPETLLRLKR